MRISVGTAGWSLPKQHSELFPVPIEGAALSHLERYATRLPCVEINSSFHRRHRRTTWERWASSTPVDFKFSVKIPKSVTHTAKLVETGEKLLEFFESVRGLGSKLGPVLVQLPPKLLFDEGVAQEFFTTLRELHLGGVVVEPRHQSWFTAPADQLLRSFDVARAAADPPKGSGLAAAPGGWAGLSYWRLHGSPRTYYSNYDGVWLREFAMRLRTFEAPVGDNESWVIFDNTALGHATSNATWLNDELDSPVKVTAVRLALSPVLFAQNPTSARPTLPAIPLAAAPASIPLQVSIVAESSRVRDFSAGPGGDVRSLYLQNGSVVDLAPRFSGQLGAEVRKGEKITVIGTKSEINGQSLVEAASIRLNDQTFSANAPAPGQLACGFTPPPGTPQPPPAPAPRSRNKANAPSPPDATADAPPSLKGQHGPPTPRPGLEPGPPSPRPSGAAPPPAPDGMAPPPAPQS